MSAGGEAATAEGPEVVLVKLGGSLITDKQRPRTLRREVLERLATEIATARPGMGARLVLGHGSGSFGHQAAIEAGLAGGPLRAVPAAGIAATRAAAAELDRRVAAALSAAGETPFPLAPSAAMTARRNGRPGRIALEPLVAALEQGLLPLVYGDVVLGPGGAAVISTETVLVALARRLARRGYRLRRAYWLGETAGIYDPAGETMPRLKAAEPVARALAAAVGGAAGADVTGGMRHRLDAARALGRLGVTSWIVDGRRPGLLAAALAGEEPPGTRVDPGL